MEEGKGKKGDEGGSWRKERLRKGTSEKMERTEEWRRRGRIENGNTEKNAGRRRKK